MRHVKFKALGALLLAGILLSGIFADRVKAEVDSWSGHAEYQIPFTQAITLNAAPALIVSAVPGKTLVVKSIVVTNTASGLVQLYNGSGGAGSTVIATYGGLANTPIPVPENLMRQGPRTSSGTGIYLSGATGTISGTICVREDF